VNTKHKKLKAAEAVLDAAQADCDAAHATRAAAWVVYVAALEEAYKPSKKRVKKGKS